MMIELREHAEPITQDELDSILEKHYEFINSGGAGGRWETFVTEPDLKKGLILGVYVGAKGSNGEQLKLSHKNLEKVNLENIFLQYGDLVGVLCRKQSLKDSSLEGSLLTDSDFSGSNFENANLTNADFSRSRMVHCNFKNANLTGTDLEDVDLTGSDLRGAMIDGTSFKNTIMKDILKD